MRVAVAPSEQKIITPEIFLDLFLLCLYWWSRREDNLKSRCLSPHEVVERLIYLQIIPLGRGRRMPYGFVATQQLFGRNIERIDTRAPLEPALEQSTRSFIMRWSFLKSFSPEAATRNKLYLTTVGARRAEALAAKYADLLDSKRFLPPETTEPRQSSKTRRNPLGNRHGRVTR